MSTLPAGDVTTQVRIYLDTNAAGSDVMTKLKSALVTTLSANPAIKTTELLVQYIAR